MNALLHDLKGDLGHGLRALWKSPGLTAAAALCLALAIGANGAMFGALDAVLLRPLPFREPDRLVWLFATNPLIGYARLPPNWENETFTELEAASRSFARTAHLREKEFILRAGDRSELVSGLRASAHLLDLLGVRPAHGRPFLPEEDEWGRHRVVLLSHEFWERRFGRDPGILEKTIDLIDTELSDRTGRPHDTLEVQAYRVAGILPRGFRFPRAAGQFDLAGGNLGFRGTADIWEPESLNPEERRARSVLDFIIARLRPEVSLGAAEEETRALFQRLREEARRADPAAAPGYGVEVLPLRTQVAGRAAGALLLLFAATGLVVLIACVNVAGLLLARGAARRREFAIRAALGAGRLRLIRQLLIESCLLALLGGGAGLVLAAWGLDALVALSPAELPRAEEIGLDGRVLLFTLGLSLGAGLLSGLAPALEASRVDLGRSLKEGGRGSGAGRRASRMRGLLVAGEVALSVVLLAGAGLLIRSFAALLDVHPGYEPERVATFQVSLRDPRYTDGAARAFLEGLIERLEGLPGVECAALASWVPVRGGPERFAAGFSIEGKAGPGPGHSEHVAVAPMTFVGPRYFQSMGIPLLRGRDFRREDLIPGAPPARIVSVGFVRQHFPDEDPLGKRISFFGRSGEVVGVVGDTIESGLEVRAGPHLYHAGVAGQRSVSIVVRAAGGSPDLAAAIQREVRSLDPDQPHPAVTTMERILRESVGERRFAMLLLGALAGLALLLAAIGIYGVVSHSVVQRTHEIGVRMALGARVGEVLGRVIGRGLRPVLIGLGLGLGGALAATRLLQSRLFGVTPADPATYAGVTFILAAVALLACYLPARRAARVDPMAALRHE